MKDEICPECGSSGRLCSHPDYDGDSCPDNLESCDIPCTHLIQCPTCKGEGLVSLAVLSRHCKKTAGIIWGKNP